MASRQRSSIAWLSPHFMAIAEISSFMLVLAGLLSVALNTFIFKSMGLSFIDVASPSDIVMSGLRLLFIFVIYSIKYLIISSAIMFVLIKVQKYIKEKLIDRLFGRRINPHVILCYKFSIIVAVFATILIYVIDIYYEIANGGGVKEFIEYSIYRNALWSDLWFFAILMASVPFLTMAFKKHLAYIAIFSSSIILLHFYAYAQTKYYNNRIDVAAKDGKRICPSSYRSKSVWTGSQSVVIYCYISPEDRIYVVVNRSDVMLFTSEYKLLNTRSFSRKSGRDWRRFSATGNSDAAVTEEIYIDVSDIEYDTDAIHVWAAYKLWDNDKPKGDISRLISVAVSCQTGFAEEEAKYEYFEPLSEFRLVTPSSGVGNSFTPWWQLCQTNLQKLPKVNIRSEGPTTRVRTSLVARNSPYDALE